MNKTNYTYEEWQYDEYHDEFTQNLLEQFHWEEYYGHNYHIMAKITREQFKQFEKEYLRQLLETPDYRFGQAFLNKFGESMIQDEVIEGISLNQKPGMPSTWQVWEERDYKRARKMVLKFVE
jgi:hypothetical protein